MKKIENWWLRWRRYRHYKFTVQFTGTAPIGMILIGSLNGQAEYMERGRYLSLRVSDKISFWYRKNTYVSGRVIAISDSRVSLNLETNYIGKNEKWFIGENKVFNKDKMKRINKQ